MQRLAWSMPWWWPWGRGPLRPTPDEALKRLQAHLAPQLHKAPLRAGYLVGGAVRDALLGRDPVDLDWLVIDPEGLSRALAAEPGATRIALDEARGHYRVVWRDRAESWDFAPPQTPSGERDPRAPGALEADLRSRDVSINAIAFDPTEGALIDPCGALADLQAGRVRSLGRGNLEADPLRTLRVVRIAAQLGFKIERETRRQIAAVAAALGQGAHPHPASERIGAELAAMLATPSAGRAFAALDALGLLDVFLPELAEGRGVAQGSLHHLDVLAHQLEALQQLVDGFPDADLPLRWATLLHDLGKPRTRTPGALTEDGLKVRDRFHGHDQVGATMARELLRRLRRPQREIERSGALVAAHMRPLPEPGRAAQRFVHRTRELLPDLLQLMLADREAARGRAASAQARRRYRERVGVVLEALAANPPTAPLIGGGELIEALGLSPGPTVGVLLREIAEATALGDLRDPPEALRYAAQRLEQLRAAAAQSDRADADPSRSARPSSG